MNNAEKAAEKIYDSSDGGFTKPMDNSVGIFYYKTTMAEVVVKVWGPIIQAAIDADGAEKDEQYKQNNLFLIGILDQIAEENGINIDGTWQDRAMLLPDKIKHRIAELLEALEPFAETGEHYKNENRHPESSLHQFAKYYFRAAEVRGKP